MRIYCFLASLVALNCLSCSQDLEPQRETIQPRQIAPRGEDFTPDGQIDFNISGPGDCESFLVLTDSWTKYTWYSDDPDFHFDLMHGTADRPYYVLGAHSQMGWQYLPLDPGRYWFRVKCKSGSESRISVTRDAAVDPEWTLSETHFWGKAGQAAKPE